MPINIAICDDERGICENIQSLVKSQCEDCHIDLYHSGEALLNANVMYDMYFLDIQMGGINGMKTAERLREGNPADKKESVIIFITAHKDYLLDAFDVKAFHYLIKPLDENKFISVFSRALGEHQQQEKYAERHIHIKGGGNYHKIPIKDIFYVESQGKKVIIHTKDGIVECYEKMKEMEKRLGSVFFRSHRCYLINLIHVTRYNAATVRLANGDDAMLAQKKFQEFVKAYLLFERESRVPP